MVMHTPSQPHSNSSNGYKDTDNGHTVNVPAKQQIISTLEELRTELDQADWAETGPLRDRIRKLKELVSVLPYQDGGDGFEVEQVQAIASKIRQFSDLDTLLATAVMEVQNALQADRVVVYEFTNPTLGIVAAEAMRDGFTPMLKEKLPAVTFGLGSAKLYQQEKLAAIADTHTASLSPYQKQLMERFQVRASLSLPILTKDGVWGLLVVQQCTAPRQWQNAEIRSLKLLAQELEAQLQVAVIQATLQQEVEKDQILTGVASKILQSKDVDTIFRVATQEVRQSLKCDRVAIYRFQPDWSGEFVAESAGSEWVSLLEEQRNNPAIVKNVNYCSVRNFAEEGGLVGTTGRSHSADSYIQHTQGKNFHRGQIYRVTNDIYSGGFSDCYIKVLETYQAKAYIIVAIFQGEKLWGLLAAYQNSQPRQWKDSEVRLMVQVASLSSIAIQQLQYQQQLYQRSEESAKLVERERTVFGIIEKIGQAMDLRTLFRTTTQELRRFLKCDRAVVYQFYPDWSGEVIAESVAAGWSSLLDIQEQENILKTGMVSSERCHVKDYGSPIKPDGDTYLKETQGGMYAKEKRFRKVNDIYAAGFSPCYLEALEKFQAKAYIIVPIFRAGSLWGLLAAYQNSDVRKWTDEETGALLQIGESLSIALQQAEYIEQLRLKNIEMTQVAEVENAIARMTDRMLHSQHLETIYRTTLAELRQLFKCDRLAIYRFNSDWSGKFMAESVGTDWVPLVGPDIKTVWEDEHLQQTQGGRYRNNETFVVNDIYTVGHAQCHIDLLEQFQAKAYTIAPIFAGNKLWGLLGAYQNSGPRQWNSEEVRLLTKLGIQLGLSVQQAEYIEELKTKNTELAQAAEEEQVLTGMVEKIRQAQEADTIFLNVLPSLRKQLQCDRLAVFRFHPDWSVEFVAESVKDQWLSLGGSDIKTIWMDEHLQETQGGRYRNHETFVVNDIYTVGHVQCYLEILEKIQAKAYTIAPIFIGNKLWGFIGAYQNIGPREWKSKDVQLLRKVAVQMGIGLQQVQYIEQLKKKNAELARAAEGQRALTRLSEKIRQVQELDTIFRNALPELRSHLECDRLAVYRFNPDWGGEFIAESVSREWVALVGPDIRTVWEDEHLQQTQGGRYRNNETFVINDIYTSGHAQCHIKILEQFQMRAYIITPIIAGNKLWGLLGAYQNSGPRQWQDNEVNLVTKIGTQFGVAVQQSQYLQQTLTKNEELIKLAEREVANARFSYRLPSRLTEMAQSHSNVLEFVQFATHELRQLLKVDRVGVYRFEPDWSGEFVVESVSGDWPKLVGTSLARVRDTYLQYNQGGRYVRKESLRVDNIYSVGHDECHIQLLEMWGTKAYMISPIFQENRLWGLMGVYQNSAPRQWEQSEEDVLNQASVQIGLALNLADYLTQVRTQEQQLAEAAERERTAREKLQQGAIRVLMALEPSFRGDLTVRAPLSEDEIGTIADGYNTTIQSLRDLVRQVQIAASKVSENSSNNTTSVVQLSNQAQQQAERLERALEQLQMMVTSTQVVAVDAQRVGQAVQQANKTVQAGDSLMERTVDGILEIRETVSETAKKIKRLGEASQKISKVVSLIENFATQTNLLALNAAIEATRAGEYGKGFAVVADEVRSLAYQSASATTEIERLVQEIQSGTNEVTEAMEVGITQVVQGSNLIDETRHSLSAIVAATNEIGGLVQGITQAVSTQSQQSQMLTEAMMDVSAIARKTSQSAMNISESFEELLTTSQQLETSVSQFKVD
ncbi:GAF domain-containing protein [Nostocaceae cyanobacterium CENA369]|uniref:GAF domain-containing protein n=1 Tax=Dendronalium phyllosphericum CENA369 TaxID=1725256 RepID=A0A8J7I529_9NOST|nr:GAF domain-containing protein [Dendronalium phyllosphericum]MBH8572087.1 GAF domain-containing protein [Dendronalium phyllosphericum CENA369]